MIPELKLNLFLKISISCVSKGNIKQPLLSLSAPWIRLFHNEKNKKGFICKESKFIGPDGGSRVVKQSRAPILDCPLWIRKFTV